MLFVVVVNRTNMFFRSIVVLVAVLISCLDFCVATARSCALNPDLSGLGEAILFDSAATKVSFSGFAASVSYVTLATGKEVKKATVVSVATCVYATILFADLRGGRCYVDPF